MGDPNSKASADIGGKPLILTSPVKWDLTEGVTPSVGIFDIAPDDAASLIKGGPYTLTINPTDGAPVVVSNLWPLNILPGPNPWISRIVVADRRWIWPYFQVGPIRMNIRRNIGAKRIIANDKFASTQDIAMEISYAHFSLDKNEKQRWVALSALQRVFKDLSEGERGFSGTGFQVKIDERIGNKIKGLPVENFEIDDSGDSAARRILSYLPDAGLTVDYDGTIIIFSRAGGDEENIVKALLPELRDHGHTDLVKNSRIRPKKVRVWFTRKVEMRFDFVEVAAAQTTVATQLDPLGDARKLDNVIPITDYNLTVSEISPNPLCQGTWITVDQAFRSWPTLQFAGPQGKSKKIDHDLIQRAFIPHMDLWAALGAAGDRPDARGNLNNWSGRFAALQQHYRQTFRINRRWMDRFLSIEAYRVATIDPQTGDRGPARAWGDYCILPTSRSSYRSAQLGKPMEFAINRSAFPSGGNLGQYDNVTINGTSYQVTLEPSPAEVSILDHDQGIIRLDYKGTDPLSGEHRTILPSIMDYGTVPSWDLNKQKSITYDSIINKNARPPKLSPTFKMSLIVTVVPASPNSKYQLHMIEIQPGDVADMLPVGQKNGLTDAQGPIMDVRIGANVEVARIQWSDARKNDIESIFGVSNGQVNVPQAPPNLSGLVINEGSATDLQKGGSLNQIAKAAAARIYGSLVDRYQGEMTGAMNGNVHLSGNVDRISHELGPRAEPTTKVTFPQTIPQISLFSFLDSNTRAAILHLARVER